MLGLRLKNTTGSHLMQGPVTVFEGSAYAGDALPFFQWDVTAWDEHRWYF